MQGLGASKTIGSRDPNPKPKFPINSNGWNPKFQAVYPRPFFEVLILLSVIFGESGIAVPATLI
jgi:hypothetical protein